MTAPYLCFHGHFYQPPRGNPFRDEELGYEPGAEPYQNWNEKITHECYAPNAELGNFELISFNVGGTLLRWLEANAPNTYARILAADQANVQRWGKGNALAQPVHHTILPLGKRPDKATQVIWGLASFEHRFGRKAEGLWLPEMAVDMDTLEVAAEQGLAFTLLSQSQVTGADKGAGPYWVNLPAGRRIAVFVRDDRLSNELSFGLPTLGGAGRWARETLVPHRKQAGRLTLLASDGETFGHHHRGEEHFLHWLLAYEARAVGYRITTLARDLRDHPPQSEVEIKEFTAWSCQHGLARWATGCACTPGDSRWKGALRRALDNLASSIDEALRIEARAAGADPWQLRDRYFEVFLGRSGWPEFQAEHGLSHLPTAQAERLRNLLAAQFYRQRMYVSCTFFFEDLDRPEPRYSLANALCGLQFVRRATGEDLGPAFRRDLATAVSAVSGKTGQQLLDEVSAWENP